MVENFADLILFAIIAGFIAFCLFRVLGQRDDQPTLPKYLKQHEKPTEEEALIGFPLLNVETTPRILTPAVNPIDSTNPAVVPTLEEVVAHDPSFTESNFLKGAQAAFEMIVQAYSKGDKEALKDLLNADLYRVFCDDIDQRNARGEVMETTLVSFKSTEIVEAAIKKPLALLTVKFVTEQITIIRDKAGQIIKGHPSYIEQIIDLWTFCRNMRTSSPHWQLTSTRGH